MAWQETFQLWSEFPNLDAQMKQDLSQMDLVEREEAFSQPLEFGTAGMRGVMGPGINRMNIYTVGQASEGLAQYIVARGSEAKQKGVVIAYDSRHQSQDFALHAALVLGNHGIKTYIYESLRPTPVLSFAVRYLETFAGIMITASHNPAEYNGYKLYNHLGGQMPPEAMADVLAFIQNIDNPLTISLADRNQLIASGLLEIIGDQVDQAYLDQLRSVNLDQNLLQRMGDQLKLVYTPLHGTGAYLAKKALVQAGFSQVKFVEEQTQPDGDFPTVSLPNPEDPAAFTLAEQLGRDNGADILLATDPDADRLGLMVADHEGEFHFLTGNQIASLMLYYLLEQKASQGQLTSNSVVVKSIVSTHLADRLGQAYGIQVQNVLTGFKYIADKIDLFERQHSANFIFGFEESYGYLLRAFTRDKDALQALLFIGEMAAYYKEQDRNLLQVLEEIYQSYGYYYEKTISVAFPGLKGQAKMEKFMQALRDQSQHKFANLQVETRYDYLQGVAIDAQGRATSLSLPKANVLKYLLEDGSWLAFRPSGTEPKMKIYLGAVADDQTASLNKLKRLAEVARQLIQPALE
ncbi:phospho-sugar mutase [Ignavigranum ruoffiae]|uniref:Phosphoglucomutase n=1 Tax=Ignavigranum ruoffiae TaxID=89093 RepID=A0A1H9DHX2_9LACT|nr:phospho-sugar mutase [Ignavigranum ruoffiae]UPQ86264.1 phospho-sugar mutase [Ignavigranum ruoffiae]SEQ12373.1 phosphoglucomutase [Ignavigranum ruoffiae]